jgi:hypothetical protein
VVEKSRAEESLLQEQVYRNCSCVDARIRKCHTQASQVSAVSPLSAIKRMSVAGGRGREEAREDLEQAQASCANERSEGASNSGHCPNYRQAHLPLNTSLIVHNYAFTRRSWEAYLHESMSK